MKMAARFSAIHTELVSSNHPFGIHYDLPSTHIGTSSVRKVGGC